MASMLAKIAYVTSSIVPLHRLTKVTGEEQAAVLYVECYKGRVPAFTAARGGPCGAGREWVRDSVLDERDDEDGAEGGQGGRSRRV